MLPYTALLLQLSTAGGTSTINNTTTDVRTDGSRSRLSRPAKMHCTCETTDGQILAFENLPRGRRGYAAGSARKEGNNYSMTECASIERGPRSPGGYQATGPINYNVVQNVAYLCGRGRRREPAHRRNSIGNQ